MEKDRTVIEQWRSFLEHKDIPVFVFNICVIFLEWMAKLVGSTYVRINVWIFCVILPILFIASLILNVVLMTKH